MKGCKQGYKKQSLKGLPQGMKGTERGYLHSRGAWGRGGLGWLPSLLHSAPPVLWPVTLQTVSLTHLHNLLYLFIKATQKVKYKTRVACTWLIKLTLPSKSTEINVSSLHPNSVWDPILLMQHHISQSCGFPTHGRSAVTEALPTGVINDSSDGLIIDNHHDLCQNECRAKDECRH